MTLTNINSPCKGCPNKVFAIENGVVTDDCRLWCKGYLEFQAELDVIREKRAKAVRDSNALNDAYSARRQRRNNLMTMLQKRGRH